MKKTFALLLVASLLLAGCTELVSSDDDETKKIEVNEDIAIEKINDFVTVDEDESFGITLMYDMDSSALEDMGFDVEEDGEDTVLTVEMTEAWSPEGYHSSNIMGLGNEDVTYTMIETITHIDRTIYVTIGYEVTGEPPADATAEEIEEFDQFVAMMPEVQSYYMRTATTHTEVIAAMAEETADNSDDLDPMAMIEFFTFVECMGVFTPAESVDGLQVFDVSMNDMEDSVSPEMALCVADVDDSDSISFEEFTSSDETSDEDMEHMRTSFDDADSNGDGELTADELEAFIEAVDAHYDEEDSEDDMDEEDSSDEMPDMAVAFNSAGEIEYLSMDMEGTEMKMYVLTEDRVDSLFTDVDAGELVALPFEISSDLDPWATDDYFVCDDGEMIPMSYVNDGMEDCSDGEDEDSMGDDEFVCDDGYTIPMDWVNDGVHDCSGGEDEMDMGDDHDDHDHDDHGDDHDDHHDDEFTCDDGETIPMDWVNDGEEDCVGGEDEGYVWTIVYDNCADSDHGLSSLDCWNDEWDVDGDGEQDFDDSYWNYECEQLADGTWECMTDRINYYDNCALEGEDYECWLNEWDTDDDGSYDLGSDGYMDYECQQLDDGRWACSHSDDDWVEITFICGDGTEILFEYVNDGDADCSDGADEQQYDADGVEINWFDCMDGSQVWISQVNDGSEDCPDGEDEMPEMDDDWVEITFICGDGTEILFEYVNDGDADCSDGADEQQYDADGVEINWFDCMDGSQVWISQVNDGSEDCPDGEDEMPDMSDGHDDHDHDDHGDEDMVCYDMSTHSVDHSIDNQADCEDAGYMWTEDQSDDHDGHDHDDHSDDHDGHDHDDHDDHDHGDDDEIVMYITSEMDFHFEGDMSDYKIELATCEENYDMDTGEETRTCTTVMSVAIADAGADSDIMFHDADSSGTISVGDMIHISETAESWDTVRLYSITADAYSDENPMLTVPGFTGLVGMLALLGAAFIRRNE